MEDAVTRNTKVSDSGYSNSCSNSQSQRSGSSKSRHSGSSSGSSGYCGHPSTLGSCNDSFQHPSATKQRKEYKKKKLKAMTSSDVLNDNGVVTDLATNGAQLETIPDDTDISNANVENDFSTSNSQNIEKNETVQLNPISHPSLSISCIKKLKRKDVVVSEEINEGKAITPTGIDDKTDNEVVVSHVHTTPSLKEEFSAVVSMQEGVVIYTTSSLTDVLGYPKDMWLGRSLIDFVHPKDRKAFNTHVTSGIATPLADRHNNHQNNNETSPPNNINNKTNSFYCCLRQYRSLKATGFGVVDKTVSYLPCQLTLAFREISTKTLSLALEYNSNDEKTDAAKDKNVLRAILLVITARLVHSVYEKPNEICATSTFSTRHSTAMEYMHVDSEVVTYLGYLPQDMIGRSVFDFYHPEDLLFLKEVYENVFKDKGQPFRSKPYRFRTQNGGFAEVETEWSCFVNPWTKKVEFVTGQHRVIKGPPNPDVMLLASEPEPLQLSEEIVKESKAIKEEISNILNETAETQNTSKNQMTRYCKELLKFIEHFVDVEKNPSTKSEVKLASLPISKTLPNEKGNTENQSERVSTQADGRVEGWSGASEQCKDRDSVMLGEISPHHEYYDSKSSSETPPSYTQLNYNDNIQRFFESKPKTTLSDESSGSKTSHCGERNTQLSGSGGDDEGKISPVVDSSCGGSQNRNSRLNNESGGSSDLSSGSASGGNNNNGASVNKYRTPHLTEELLSKHNENMEKKMVQMHRERNKSDREHKLKDGRTKKNYDKILEEQNSHGVKRSGSHSWEGEPYKTVKQTHATPEVNDGNTSGPKVPEVPASTAVHLKQAVNSLSNGNIWPPFTVSVTPLHTTPPCATHLSYPAAAPVTNAMMPVYYLPSQVPSSARINGSNCPTETVRPPPLSQYVQPAQPPPQPQPSYVQGHFQYLTSMMYQPMAAMPMLGLPQVMYSPLTMLPAPLLPTQPMKPQPQQTQPLWDQRQKQPSQLPDCNITIQSQQRKKSSTGKSTQRPASQATSVKAEPGSALCSVASNSMQQEALSETSKREEKSMDTPSPQSIGSQGSGDGSNLEKVKSELEDINSNDLLEMSDQINNDSSSYYSSFYSFIMKTDESMRSLTENESSASVEMVTPADSRPEGMGRKKPKDVPEPMKRRVRKVPPWMENISLSPDLVFRYQVSEKKLSDVLEADLKLLTDINQPLMVNDQLCQLYLDIENFQQQDCSLETSLGITSSSGNSSGEGDDTPLTTVKSKKKHRTMEYHDRMVMLFEENAPMPPPLSHINPSLLSVQSS